MHFSELLGKHLSFSFSSARTYDNLDACVVVRSPDLITAASLMEVCVIVYYCLLCTI